MNKMIENIQNVFIVEIMATLPKNVFIKEIIDEKDHDLKLLIIIWLHWSVTYVIRKDIELPVVFWTEGLRLKEVLILIHTVENQEEKIGEENI